MKASLEERLSYRKKTRIEGERYIAEKIIPRLRESWLQLGPIYRNGRWCPILANKHPNTNTRLFIADRMDRAVGGNIGVFNDNAKSLDDVIDVLRIAASR